MSDKPSTVLERAEWVFKKGDPGDSLFLIKSGMVQIVKEINGNDVTLATLSDNEVFGEMALFSIFTFSKCSGTCRCNIN